MDEICRLCLSVSVKMKHKLGEGSKIVNDLSCLNIQIILNKSLPTFICYGCDKTLEDVLNFRENILCNQQKLLQLLDNSKNLKEYYHHLKQTESPQDFKTEIADEYTCLDYYNEQKYQPNNKQNETYKGEENSLLKLKNGGNASNTFSEKDLSKNKKKKIIINRLKKQKNNETKLKSVYNLKNNTCGIEIDSTKTIENVPEEVLTDFKLTKNNETDSNINENSLSIINQLHEIKTKDIKCLTCLKYLPSRKELIAHYKIVHNDNTDRKNDNADRVNYNADRENHNANCIKNNSEICRSDVDNKEFNIHKTSGNSERPYVCKICGRTFSSVHAIVRHGRAHGECSFRCPRACGYSTAYRGALRDHVRRHLNHYKYKCGSCGAGFHVKTWYQQHQNVHKDVRPFVCDVCGMAFHMDRYLKSHRASVHSDLASGVIRFACPHCDATFHNTKKYKTHLQEHEGKKQYLCEVCGKECSSNERLKCHYNSHAQLKPFACSICNKSLSTKFNLSVHARAHAGEQHLCTACGKHFAQRSSLLRHIRNCHPEIKLKTDIRTELTKEK